MRKVELILAISLALSIIFKNEIPVSIASYMFFPSILLLIMLYLTLGFALFNGVRFREFLKRNKYQNIKGSYLALGILTGILITIFLLSVVFKLMHWSYGIAGIQVTTAFFFLAIIIALLMKNKGNNNIFYTELLPRSCFYASLGMHIILR